MIVESPRTRRSFIAAAAATGVAAVCALASDRFAQVLELDPTGSLSILTGDDVREMVPAGSSDAWRNAVGSIVRIVGEQGTVDARIVTVVDGATGGDRPEGIRADTLIAYFETDPARAPAGDRTYSILSSIPALTDLFLQRGQDVMGRAVLLAIIN